MVEKKQTGYFEVRSRLAPERFPLSYDSATGIIGFGYRYGEHSINGEPAHAAPPYLFWGSRGPLYDPFARKR